MRKHTPRQKSQQQDGKDADLNLSRPAGRRLTELSLGQAGEVHEQRADQGDATGQAKPLETRKAALVHHAVKLKQADDVKQHDDATDEVHGDRAASQQTVKDNPQQYHGAGEAPHEDESPRTGLDGFIH